MPTQFPIVTRYGNVPIVSKGLANKEYVDGFHVVKQVSQTQVSTVTVVIDDELFIPLEANRVYSFILTLLVKSHATADFRWDFSAPSGATGQYSLNALSSNVPQSGVVFGTETTGATNDTVESLFLFGRVVMGATAGNLSFLWAQAVSDANDTIVQQG